MRGGRRGGVAERRAGSWSWAGGSICQLCRQTRSLATPHTSLRWGALHALHAVPRPRIRLTDMSTAAVKFISFSFMFPPWPLGLC
eukprot:COSAG01_NODE_469_length_16584_cov_10.725265_6_plen_85_part_00